MASNEPPDDTPSGRPLISSLDEPIDESGAEEVERKRAARQNAAALPDVAVEALKLKALGFSIMPVRFGMRPEILQIDLGSALNA